PEPSVPPGCSSSISSSSPKNIVCVPGCNRVLAKVNGVEHAAPERRPVHHVPCGKITPASRPGRAVA
ncbi:hypothetical protein, partial [Streptomyces sp. NPDC049881]|uniref:hypothetical protein n=1 Tax=Streptomyces sp. NPDC049881 TaxID=3155778 RepID=UPI00342E73A9